MKRLCLERHRNSTDNVKMATAAFFRMCVKYEADVVREMKINYRLLTGEDILEECTAESDVTLFNLVGVEAKSPSIEDPIWEEDLFDEFVPVEEYHTCYIYTIDHKLFYGPFCEEYPIGRLDLWPWAARQCSSPPISSDLATLITTHLTPIDTRRCMGVSKNWRACFGTDRVWQRFATFLRFPVISKPSWHVTDNGKRRLQVRSIVAGNKTDDAESEPTSPVYLWYRHRYPLFMPDSTRGVDCLRWLKTYWYWATLIVEANLLGFEYEPFSPSINESSTRTAWRVTVRFKGKDRFLPQLRIAVQYGRVVYTAHWSDAGNYEYNDGKVWPLNSLFAAYLDLSAGIPVTSAFSRWSAYKRRM